MADNKINLNQSGVNNNLVTIVAMLIFALFVILFIGKPDLYDAIVSRIMVK